VVVLSQLMMGTDLLEKVVEFFFTGKVMVFGSDKQLCKCFEEG